MARLCSVLLCFAACFAIAGDVAPSDERINPLLIGAKVPDMALLNSDGNEKKLSEIFSQKPTIMVFYRGGW